MTPQTTQRKPGFIARRMERLRDEVHLDMHLARMDARDRVREIEPWLFQVERLAGHLAEISFNAVEQIATEVKRFRGLPGRRRPLG